MTKVRIKVNKLETLEGFPQHVSISVMIHFNPDTISVSCPGVLDSTLFFRRRGAFRVITVDRSGSKGIGWLVSITKVYLDSIYN